MRLHVSTEEMLSTKTKIKILKHLFFANSSMSENEIAELINLSHMTINRIMKELQAMNLTFSERAGNALLWKVNKDSYAYQALLPIIVQIAKTTPPVEHLIKTILICVPRKMIEKILLFGSVAAQKEKPNSDIDLFIQVKNTAAKNKLQSFIDKLSDICLNCYGNKLSPYVLTAAELHKKPRALRLEIEKGRQIYP